MILPNKYISISESLIGLSAIILQLISDNAYTTEEVWNRLNKEYIETDRLKSKPSYSKFILCITYMYLSNMINYTKEGVIFNENIAT